MNSAVCSIPRVMQQRPFRMDRPRSLQGCIESLFLNTDYVYMLFSIPNMRFIPVLNMFRIKCSHECKEIGLLIFLCKY